MVRGSIGVRRPALLTLAGIFVFSLAGCPSDPYDPDTWIEKLDNPEEVELALTKLDQLHDPVAIKPLGKTWRKHNKWSRVLRVIINLADQTCPPERQKEGTKNPCNEFEKNGPHWEDAIPILTEAVGDFDISDRRSIEDAVVSADALGRAKDPETVQTLVNAALKKLPKLSPGQRVRIAAVRALGNFGNNARAVDTIIKVLQMDPEKQPLQVNAAAANALADTGSKKSIQPLLIALFEISPIYQQVRTALTRVGPPVVPELIKIFQGKHKKLNEFADKHNFSKDCDKAMGPDTGCQAPGNLEFKSASLLGDMRAEKAVPVLLKGLREEPKVAFFDNKTGAPGPTNHNAILDALRNIGDPSAADDVRSYMMNDKTLDQIRPIAIDVYSFLARDGKAMDWLAKQVKDDGQEEQIRKASGLSYARLIYKKGQLGPLDFMINRYRKEAEKWDKKAEKAKKEKDKTYNEGTAEGYRELVQEFEQYKVRGLVGIKCQKDPKCYAKILDMKADDVIGMLDIPKKERDKLAEPVKKNYRIAALERALFELMKLGPKARPELDKLLEHAKSTERIVRQGVLMALVRVAKKPCKQCTERLREVIASQKDQTTLDYLTADTRIVMHYFMTAK